MYWPAFLLGLLGSLHCAVMCAPIMLTVPWKGTASLQVLFNKLVYQAGRISIYIALGSLLFLGGRRLLLSNFQQSIGIVVGIGLVLFALMGLFRSTNRGLWIMKLYQKITRPFGALLASKSHLSRFVLGALNGLLPCGLVYIAAFTSITMESVSQAAIYMLIFGIGTLPMLSAILVGAQWGKKKFKFSFNRLKPAALVLMGTYFIIRSMELGIPYLSPVLEVSGVDGISTCAP